MSGDTRPSQEKRAAILEAAATIIAARGFHGMGMRDLARSAGWGASSLYNYFSSKEELLYHLQLEAFETLNESARAAIDTADDASSKLFAFVFNHVRYVVEHRDVMRVLVHEAGTLPSDRRHAVREMKEAYFETGLACVSATLEHEGGEAWTSPARECLTYNLFGMLNWLYGWYEPDRHGPPEAVAHSIHHTLLRGVQGGPVMIAGPSAGELLTEGAPPLIRGSRPATIDIEGRTI